MISFLLEISPVYFKMPKTELSVEGNAGSHLSWISRDCRGVLLVTTLHGRDRNTVKKPTTFLRLLPSSGKMGKEKEDLCKPAYSKSWSRTPDTTIIIQLTAISQSVTVSGPCSARLHGMKPEGLYSVRNIRSHLHKVTEFNVLCR
jgi:hypothetical protein